jgi:hypothetical protein
MNSCLFVVYLGMLCNLQGFMASSDRIIVNAPRLCWTLSSIRGLFNTDDVSGVVSLPTLRDRLLLR